MMRRTNISFTLLVLAILVGKPYFLITAQKLLTAGGNFTSRRTQACDLPRFYIDPPDSINKVSFANGNNVIQLVYRMDNQVFSVSLYNECDRLSSEGRIEVPSDVVEADVTRASTTTGCAELDLYLRFHIGKLDSSFVYTDYPETNSGVVKFCVEMILSLEDMWGNEGKNPHENLRDEVTYSQLFLSANISYEVGFQISDVTLDIENEGVKEQDAKIEYDIYACHCDHNGVCSADISPDLKVMQSEDLLICLHTPAPGVIIKEVTNLSLMQTTVDLEEISLPAIVNTASNMLTFVSGEKSKNVVIKTKLVSVFFLDLESPVSANGTCILDFETLELDNPRPEDETLEDGSNGSRRLKEVSFSFVNSFSRNTKEVEQEIIEPFGIRNIKLQAETVQLDTAGSSRCTFCMVVVIAQSVFVFLFDSFLGIG